MELEDLKSTEDVAALSREQIAALGTDAVLARFREIQKYEESTAREKRNKVKEEELTVDIIKEMSPEEVRERREEILRFWNEKQPWRQGW